MDSLANSKIITEGNKISVWEFGDYFPYSRFSTNEHFVTFMENGINGIVDLFEFTHFNKDIKECNNCFISNDGGKTWKAPKVPPHGYRSSVEFLSMKDIMTCGLNGVDYSTNGGKEWQWISKESFNVCRIAKLGTTIYLAGNNGKVAKILWR